MFFISYSHTVGKMAYYSGLEVQIKTQRRKLICKSKKLKNNRKSENLAAKEKKHNHNRQITTKKKLIALPFKLNHGGGYRRDNEHL